MRKKGFLSITTRYLLHLSGAGAFLSILLIWNASYQQKQIVLKEMEQRTLLLCESLGNASSLRYFLGDTKAIRYLFDKAIEIQDVSSILLIDKKGAVEIQSGSMSGGYTPQNILETKNTSVWRDENYIHALAPLTIQRQKARGVMDMLLDPSQPNDAPSNDSLETDTLGYISVNMSLTRARAYIKSLILRSVAATLIIILFGSAVAFYFFKRAIITPIQDLAEAMTKGDLTERAVVTSNDEIGELANSFNTMLQEIKKSRYELENYNQTLSMKVADRTKDLEMALNSLNEAQEKMLRSQKLATIGQLASSVGHELRNPLGAINNAIYYIRDSLKDTEIIKSDQMLAEFLDMAESEIQGATNIIKDLLDFSHVGQLQLQPTNVNELLKSVRSVIPVPENVKIINALDLSLPIIMVDPQRLRQVFINLITNAIQAMPDGGELEINTRYENVGNDLLVVWINFKDTGTGISEETMKKIFEPLFTTKVKGTGLGLCICQGIIETHGGKIIVESVLGKGTVFKVRLSGVTRAVQGEKA